MRCGSAMLRRAGYSERKLRQFTRGEVAKHSQAGDCWVILAGKVYNVSSWLDIHPGGSNPLISHAGKDGTDAWEEAGHTARARRLMDRYVVGEIVPEQVQRRYSGYVGVPGDDDNANYYEEGFEDESYLQDISTFKVHSEKSK